MAHYHKGNISPNVSHVKLEKVAIINKLIDEIKSEIKEEAQNEAK